MMRTIDSSVRALPKQLPEIRSTAAVWFTEPDVAVIVADPSAIAVTSPADDTVATDELDVAHVTVAPLIVLLLASLTVGTSVVVSSVDANDKLVGDSVTLDAT